jgi:competence protein ComEC
MVIIGSGIASCGVRNRFGHPHAEALATLAARGVTVVRTDRGGGMIWETDGAEVRWARPGEPLRAKRVR